MAPYGMEQCGSGASQKNRFYREASGEPLQGADVVKRTSQKGKCGLMMGKRSGARTRLTLPLPETPMERMWPKTVNAEVGRRDSSIDL